MEKALERHELFLLDRLDPNSGLLDLLLAGGLLPRGEIQKIQLASNTTEAKNRLLLDYVMRKNIAERFLGVVAMSGQVHLVNYVRADGVNFDFGEDWPISDCQIDILDNNRVSLIEFIDPSDLCNRLFARGVINNRQREFLSSRPTNSEKNEVLLDVLRQSSLRQFNDTITCLCESNQQHITTILLGKETPETSSGIRNEQEHEEEAEDAEDGVIHSYSAEDRRCTAVLTRTIRTRSSEEEMSAVYGITVLDGELFIISQKIPEVEVYDSTDFRFRRRWKLEELVFPMDMGSCNRNKCLYIIDCKGFQATSVIFRLDSNGEVIKDWPIGDEFGCLSVACDSNIILASYAKNKLNQYSPEGQLIGEVILNGILHPIHALKLTTGHFVVSHGAIGDILHRVCVVDASGEVRRIFGGKNGSSDDHVHVPGHLAVDVNGLLVVADCMNSRMLLLNSNLSFRQEILTKEDYGLRLPFRFYYDNSNRGLYVVDNADPWSDGRILVFTLQ